MYKKSEVCWKNLNTCTLYAISIYKVHVSTRSKHLSLLLDSPKKTVGIQLQASNPITTAFGDNPGKCPPPLLSTAWLHFILYSVPVQRQRCSSHWRWSPPPDGSQCPWWQSPLGRPQTGGDGWSERRLSEGSQSGECSPHPWVKTREPTPKIILTHPPHKFQLLY